MDEYFAKGKRGEICLRREDGQTVLVKRKNPRSTVDTIANEARYNKLLNKHGIGPRFLRYDAERNELIREYVEGEEFRTWLPTAGKKAVRHVLHIILKQCRTMDSLGIIKLEMTRPWKHIIVTKSDEPFLIDFERCKEARAPKNVTQFCQFLTGSAMARMLREKGIIIDRTLLTLAKEYKDALRQRDRLPEERAEPAAETIFKSIEGVVHG